MALLNYSQITQKQTQGWKILSFRVPPEELTRLDAKHPHKGDRSKIMRALLQMYLEGKVTNLEHIRRQTV